MSPVSVAATQLQQQQQQPLGDVSGNGQRSRNKDGSAAEQAATRKSAKYSNIQAHHIFQPVAVESPGAINASDRVFLSKLGRKLADQSGDDREISFLFHRLSVLIQRYNAILLRDNFVKKDE